MKIGIDIMGGDYAPEVPLLGAIRARKILPASVNILLIGDKAQIRSICRANKINHKEFEIINTTEVIQMGESPTRAFSRKPNSSIAVGFRLLKQGRIDGFASNGNSGAMLVGAIYSGGVIPGVIRPSLTTAIPKQNGKVNILLDIGVNADCKTDVLYQFAILGSLYAKYIYNISKPKIGLLNIGEEEEKGNIASQATYRLMIGSGDFNFIGNVEGRDIFEDKADVIVTDGFTGNVVLKTVEAFYKLIKKRNISDSYFEKLNYENYGGCPILGVKYPVVIGHGASNERAMMNMILHTRDLIKTKLSEKIKKTFSK